MPAIIDPRLADVLTALDVKVDDTVGFSDTPKDGKVYVRKDGNWVQPTALEIWDIIRWSPSNPTGMIWIGTDADYQIQKDGVPEDALIFKREV